MLKKLFNALALCVVVAGLAMIVPAAAQAAPYCEITWGSLPKDASIVVPDPRAPGSLTNVRAGRHGCYDRLVMDVDGGAAGSVRYVAAVTADGSGDVVNLRGGAFLEIVLRNPAYDLDYRPTFTPTNPNELVNVTGWRTFRQVAYGGSFEGYTTIGLGVRARLPFRVFTLAGPGRGSRLVIDVAHRW